MTLQEQKTIDSLNKQFLDLRQSIIDFKSDMLRMVEAINKKVDEKREPLTLEKEVVNTLSESIKASFIKVMSDSYNSPLKKYAENIMTKYQKDIESVFDQIVSEGIKTEEFKSSVRITFLNKLAKTVVIGIDGSVDKTVQQMKQDPVFRSRLLLVVNSLLEEFLNQPK